MAERYWVGGTGIWDGSSTTHWAATTGGASGASVPTSADNVHFDANSFSTTGQTVTIQTNTANCANQDWTGALHSPQLIINADMDVYGNLTWITGMSCAGSGTYIHIRPVSPASVNINFAGVTIVANIDCMGTGTVTLTGDLKQSLGNASARNLYHSNGTLNFNGYVVQCNYWSGNGSANSRTFSAGASVVTVNNNAYFDGSNWTVNLNTSVWTVGAGGGLWGAPMTGTFNCNTSTIKIEKSVGFTANGKTYYAIQLKEASFVNDALTCTNLTVTKNAGSYTGPTYFSAAPTITGTFSLTGISQTDRAFVMGYAPTSGSRGSQITITAAIVSITNGDLQNIVGAGAGTWSGTSVGNMGNNSGITFTSPVTRYWVGNGGNWNDTAHWSTSSGGATGASMPLGQDTAIFDANSITSASQMIALVGMAFRTPDFVNVLNNPTMSDDGTNRRYFYGPTIRLTNTTPSMDLAIWRLCPDAAQDMTFYCGGQSVGNGEVEVDGIGGTVFLGDDFLAGNAGGFDVVAGIFDMNNRNMKLNYFTPSWTPGWTIYLRSGTITVYGSFAAVDFSTGGTPILYCGTSTIEFLGDNSNTWSFYSNGLTFYNVAITGSYGGDFLSSGGGTFNILKIDGATKSVGFQNTATFIFGMFLAHGASGQVYSIFSESPASAVTFSIAKGIVACDYIWLKDCTATGGATFYAGANSTDATGNTGWTFAAAPYTLHPAAALGAGM